MDGDTITGIASGMGGGIGVIRISGPDALTVAGRVFRTKRFIEKPDEEAWDISFFEKKASHTIHYGYIVAENGSVLDEVIVLLMKAPKSYTTEDVVEIDSHGGPFLVQKILTLLTRSGARLAEPGEFTKRAFFNGRIDLSQAEAVMKLISSKSEFALDSAVKQLEGSVSKYIEEIRQELLHHMGLIEAALDDPEHYELDGYGQVMESVIQKALEKLQALLDHFEDGRMRSEGINTVIVGKPNAGKSSLMNLLLDEDRAIVTNIAGTTRDILEETVIIGNLVLNLVDTAGIHDTEDFVEHLGVEKAKKFVYQADFVLFVLDASMPFEEADEKILPLLSDKKGVILLNKSDLDEVICLDEIRKKLDWEMIPFSSKTKEGLSELEKYITDSFLQGEISYNDQIYLINVRHREAVEKAVTSLQRVLHTIEDGMPEDLYLVDLMDAYQKLGLINGKTASEDLINKIFKEFCMGK